jgi:hypothetical protein
MGYLRVRSLARWHVAVRDLMRRGTSGRLNSASGHGDYWHNKVAIRDHTRTVEQRGLVDD